MTDTSVKKRPSFRVLLLAVVAVACVLCVIGSVVSNVLNGPTTSTPNNAVVATDAIPPAASDTPGPTNTPSPTDTPLPTFTFTPPPDPVIIQGTGDSVVDLSKWDGPAIARIAHQGGGNFAVINYGSNGDRIDLLVNVIGNYQGTVPLDFLDREHTARFEVSAGGAWEIQVLPIDMIRTEPIPGTFQGVGDDVVAFSGSALPDLLKADASSGSGNFAIWTFGSSGRDLVVNEIAPYTGTVLLDSSAFVLVLKATGPWSLEVTTR